jgi:hypothetical protein
MRLYRRVHCWAAKLREVHQQGYPGCTFHFPLLEWSPILELGHVCGLCLVSLMTTHVVLEVLSLKGAYRAGYAVLGATAISTVALVVM